MFHQATRPCMCIDILKKLPQTVLIISPDMQLCLDQISSGHVTFLLAHFQLVWFYVAALPPQFRVIARTRLLERAAACVTAAASAACSGAFQAPGNAARADLVVTLQGLQGTGMLHKYLVPLRRWRWIRPLRRALAEAASLPQEHERLSFSAAEAETQW